MYRRLPVGLGRVWPVSPLWSFTALSVGRRIEFSKRVVNRRGTVSIHTAKTLLPAEVSLAPQFHHRTLARPERSRRIFLAWRPSRPFLHRMLLVPDAFDVPRRQRASAVDARVGYCDGSRKEYAVGKPAQH